MLFVGRFSVKEGYGMNAARAKGGDESGDGEERRAAA
jgi:hypothetical protein